MEVSKVQMIGINKNHLSDNKIAFKGETNSVSNDSVEISTKKNGMSNTAKVAIGIGTIAAIVGGILLHKHFSAKSTKDAVQNTASEVSQSVRDLISQGKITQKEAELFDSIQHLEGETFVKKAYELIAKNMGFEKYPELIVDTTTETMNLAHTGENITIYTKTFEEFYKNDAKVEIVNTLRHELEHFKQGIIIFFKKGDLEYEAAFKKQKEMYFVDRALFRDVELDNILNEEAVKYGYNPASGQFNVEELYKIIFEHDTPIKTIRTMTPCDFEKLNLTEEELAKADEYLEGVKNYVTLDRLPENIILNGNIDREQVRISPYRDRIMELVGLYLNKGYMDNPTEIAARNAGETLRDKFISFLNAIK